MAHLVIAPAVGVLVGGRTDIFYQGQIVTGGDEKDVARLVAGGFLAEAETATVPISTEVEVIVPVDPVEPVKIPAKGGPGSGKQAWAEYAASVGVQVDADADRDEIIAAIETAGKPTE